MIYITVKQPPAYRQMTLEELLFNPVQKSCMLNPNITNTRTYERETLSAKFCHSVDAASLIIKLEQFNRYVDTLGLRSKERESLYHTFYVPKKTGGLRRIDAPCDELMDALRRLKEIFENDFHLLYHTSAFAYVPGRCTVDAVKRHQANESKWFAKLDLSNFFGSTTLEFVLKMFSMIYPLNMVMGVPTGKQELEKALELAFLNGGLPQGTPISPLITNVMMIPFDFKLYNAFRDFNNQQFVYTRYADDFIISSKFTFNVADVQKLVVDTLAGFEAPFTVNASKTRYGSSSGANWNLGLMLNRNNDITVGFRNKRRFQSMIYNYLQARANNTPWSIEDIMVLSGLYSYYHMVEPEATEGMIHHINKRMGVQVLKFIKQDLS